MNFTLKLHPAIFIAGLICIALLFIFLARGCEKSKNDTKKYSELSVRYDSVAKQRDSFMADNIRFNRINKDQQDTIDFLNGIVSLTKNQILSTEDNLRSANARVNDLLSRHYDIKEVDSATVVPNTFIDDCKSCFTELRNGQLLVIKYKNDWHKLDSATTEQKRIFQDQVTGLKRQLSTATGLVFKFDSLAAAYKEQAKPHGIFYLSAGVMSINGNLPNAIGGGAAYKDSRNRIFSLKVYGSQYGLIKSFDGYLPLSIKLKSKH